ncbi:MAG: hypothetical protein QXW47_02750 [Candidatus Jordarchaeales archaeon]
MLTKNHREKLEYFARMTNTFAFSFDGASQEKVSKKLKVSKID